MIYDPLEKNSSKKPFQFVFNQNHFNSRQGFKNTERLLKPQGEMLSMFQYKTNALYTVYRRMSKTKKWGSLTRDYPNYSSHLSGLNPESELRELFKDMEMTLQRFEFLENKYFVMTKRSVLGTYRYIQGLPFIFWD